MRWQGLLASFASIVLVSGTLVSGMASAQEIVSAQSGVVHYLEGAVLIDDAPVEHKPAVYPLLKEGSVLATQKGRVELMLTPGVFLRLDENSSMKMLSTNLTSTGVQFLKGSAIVDAVAAEGDIPIVLQFRDAAVRFSKPGIYRIDSETEVLQAYSGEAIVKQQEKQTRVDTSRLYFFELATDTKKFTEGTDDEFLDWARNRNQVITEENQAAQAEDDANAAPDLGASPFFNYNVPYGGLSTTPGLPTWGSIYPYGGLNYNAFAPSGFWMLPPLPTPALIIGRRWPNRPVSTKWPTSGAWASHHSPTTVPSWLVSHPAGASLPSTYPHTLTSMPRPAYSRPVIAPRVSGTAVHVGRR